MEPNRSGNRGFVLVGDAPEQAARAVAKAAEAAGETLQVESTVEDAVAWIDKRQEKPAGVVLYLDRDGAARKAVEIRRNFQLSALPIVAATSTVTDLAFEEAFASGVDDVSPLDPVRLGRRLRQLVDVAAGEVVRRDEVVVIADADRDVRLLIGRVFRGAGYQVQFAADAPEALKESMDSRVIAVITSAGIENADGDSLIGRAVKEGSRAAFIVNTPPKEMAAVRARVATSAVKVTVHDAFAAPATLLFVANELLNKPGKDVRKSERLLYGTSVRFRHAGRDDEEIGYMYNISEGGMYVRTLTPPDRWDELWLEFVPPRSDRRVHLEAQAVWARRHGPSGNASVPTGFGVQITGGSQADLERYEKSYRTFLAELVAWRESQNPFESVNPYDSITPATKR